MTWTSPPTVATGDIYTAAMFNTYTRDNTNHLRTLTGAADPGGANKALYSTGALTATWGLLPSVAMLEQKVNQVNPTYTTFAGALDKGSGIFTIENNSPSVADGPVAGVVNWHLIQSRYYNFGIDFRVQLAFTVSTTLGFYVRWITSGSPSSWYKIWTDGTDGSGSTLDADLLDGLNSGNGNGNIPISNGTVNNNLNAALLSSILAGNASGQIPISNGTLNTNLNADLHDGLNTGNGTGLIPISNGTVNTNLNADLHDGFHAGNANGQIPVSNGVENNNLNAALHGGVLITQLARVDVATNFAARPTYGSDDIPVMNQGQYTGNGVAARQITCGFVPRVVIISGYDPVTNIGIKAFIVSSTAANNVKDRLFPNSHALRGADSSACDTTRLHATDGFIVDSSGTDSTNTTSYLYKWVALG